MLSRLFITLCLPLLACGCSEGTKANPLPRAGVSVVPPTTVHGKDPGEQPSETLYVRLGREEGLTQLVDDLVAHLNAQPKSKALAAKLNKPAFVQFLSEVLTEPRPGLAADLNLTRADWLLLLPALRETLTTRRATDADRDELIAKIERSR